MSQAWLLSPETSGLPYLFGNLFEQLRPWYRIVACKSPCAAGCCYRDGNGAEECDDEDQYRQAETTSRGAHNSLVDVRECLTDGSPEDIVKGWHCCADWDDLVVCCQSSLTRIGCTQKGEMPSPNSQKTSRRYHPLAHIEQWPWAASQWDRRTLRP